MGIHLLSSPVTPKRDTSGSCANSKDSHAEQTLPTFPTTDASTQEPQGSRPWDWELEAKWFDPDTSYSKGPWEQVQNMGHQLSQSAPVCPLGDRLGNMSWVDRRLTVNTVFLFCNPQFWLFIITSRVHLWTQVPKPPTPDQWIRISGGGIRKLYIEKILQIILMQSQVEITAVEPHGLRGRKIKSLHFCCRLHDLQKSL